MAAERARSSFDTPHRFTGSFVYELPIGADKKWGSGWRGGTAALLANWQLNGIVTMQAGQPYTIALPGEFDNSNTGRSSYGFGAGDRPDVTGDPHLARPDPQLWFDPTAFSLPAFGTFGNAGRNIVGGPGLANVDFSVLKNADLGEAATLQFRAEFFQPPQHPELPEPERVLWHARLWQDAGRAQRPRSAVRDQADLLRRAASAEAIPDLRELVDTLAAHDPAGRLQRSVREAEAVSGGVAHADGICFRIESDLVDPGELPAPLRGNVDGTRVPGVPHSIEEPQRRA